ncbi:uncharacterized protein LOC129001498 isoform X1 [Macrosteles quadrilineatus]|uniref:uncharacterized protein LOC129001498 isoform X1 n=1 Tax=Macrosteles quadrilineatus TaxID=74068 RepID=UPI0023E29F88|nr:uncharacterized protein LOC129001498 isoform X1 [Macrosteles quadrilineatus]
MQCTAMLKMVKAVILLGLVCIIDIFGYDRVSKSNVGQNPVIFTETDDAFVKFQGALAAKQNELKTPIVFSDLNAFKTAFDSYVINGKLDISTPSEVDSNFAKFQNFMKKYMREYNNFDELKIRFELFKNIVQKMGGYNIGGDGLAGINHLSDKTHEEKQGFYGKRYYVIS